jgi:hypothetical protein
VGKLIVIGAALVVLVGGAAAGYLLFLRGPSREEYVAQADPICKRSNDKLGAVAAPADLVQLKDASSKLATNSSDTAAALAKLELPRGDDAAVAAQITKLIRDSDTKAKALADAAGKEDLLAAEKAAGDARAAFKAADEKARGFKMVHCGKGGAAAAESIAAASPALLKKNLVTRADALCGRAYDEINKIPDPNNAAQAREYADKSLALEDKAVADIKVLPIATADKPALDDFFASYQPYRDKFGQFLEAVLAGNTARADDLEKEMTPLTETAAKKAASFGFVDCRKLIEG